MLQIQAPTPRATLVSPTFSQLRTGLMKPRERVAGLPRRETCRRVVETIDTRYVTGYKER